MKRYILALAFIGFLWDANAQGTSETVDSLRTLLKSSKNDTNRVIILNTLAAYLIIGDDYDSSLMASNEAFLLSERLGYQAGKASSLRKQGVARIQTGEYARGLENLLQSLRINETLNNREEIFKLQNNIGNLYYSQGNYESALLWFMKAYAQKKDDAFTNENVGITYLAEKNYKLALVFLEKAMKLYAQNDDDGGISNAMNGIGTIYEYQGSYGQGLEYYFQALKIKEDINDIQGQNDVLSGISDVYIKQKKYNQAISNEEKNLRMAKEIGYWASVQETENRLHRAYEALGQKDSAYFHYKNYISIRDSIYSEDQTKKTVRAEMSFGFDKRQAIEEAVHSEEIKNQQTQRNIFVFGFLLILIFSTFLFRSFKKTKKQKNIIEEQKRIVEEHQKEVSDNLNYAAKLQRAMLPSQEYINQSFPDNMVTFLPRDTVSGDFFYNYRDERGIYFGVADATGHGISASLTASLINSLLNEIIVERKIESPELILNALKFETIKSLNQLGANEERKDGADISLCRIINGKLECACANNPIYIIRDKNIIEIKGDKFPIGMHIIDMPFTLKTFDLQNGDLVFSFSDGLSDQFGGPKNKKLMSKQFKSWLIELSSLEMSQIKLELECRFHNWKGIHGNQTDDVTIFGVRI